MIFIRPATHGDQFLLAVVSDLNNFLLVLYALRAPTRYLDSLHEGVLAYHLGYQQSSGRSFMSVPTLKRNASPTQPLSL